MGNDRCGSGEPLKRSYVITGSHTPFEPGLKVGGWVRLPTVPGETRPGNAANPDPAASAHLSAGS